VRPVAGVLLLAVVCALVLAGGRVRAGNREPVLALARPVAAGQVITASDLRVVDVSAAGPVSVVPAWRRDGVAGRTATASLPAGSLLAAGDVGGPSPARGRAWLGVALKPGRYPPGLSPGQHVGVLAAPPPGSGSGSRTRARLAGYAVVLWITPAPQPDAAAQTVAELDLPRDAVPRVAAAAAAGRVSLAVIPAGR
jgi:Flp pilus assembly protein CpaB